MEKNNYKIVKKKGFFLPVLTSLILMSCAVFTLCVYNRSNNAKAIEEAGTPDNPVSSSAIGSTDNTTGTDSGTGSGSSGIKISTSGELHGVWISFLDYNAKGYTRASFTHQVT